MSNVTKDHLRVVQHFLDRCRGRIQRVENKTEYQSYPQYNDYWKNGPSYEAYINHHQVTYADIECDLELMAKELLEYYEIQDLLRDPETRQLINEARFINRLKGGRYGNY